MNGRQFGMPSEPERPSTAHSLERVSVPPRMATSNPVPIAAPEPKPLSPPNVPVEEDDDDDDDFDFEAIRNLDRDIAPRPKPKSKSRFRLKSKAKPKRELYSEPEPELEPEPEPRPVPRVAAKRAEPAAARPVETATQPKRPPVISRTSEYVDGHSAPTAAPVKQPPHRKVPKRRYRLLIIGLGVVVLIGVGWALSSLVPRNGVSAEPTGIDNTNYQAVFFTNGQVYFGKLALFNSGYMKLQDIYYLQSASSTDASKAEESTNPQSTTKNQGDVQLIKLGDEVHGPKDEMYLAKDQILFFENLKPNSKVAQSIAEYKRTH